MSEEFNFGSSRLVLSAHVLALSVRRAYGIPITVIVPVHILPGSMTLYYSILRKTMVRKSTMLIDFENWHQMAYILA